jgi:hypothetical protein
MQAMLEELAARIIFYRGLIPLSFGATTVGFAFYASRCAEESYRATLIGREASKRMDGHGRLVPEPQDRSENVEHAPDHGVNEKLRRDGVARREESSAKEHARRVESEFRQLQLDKKGMTNYARQMQAHSMTVSSITAYTAITCVESVKDFIEYRKLSLNDVGRFFLKNRLPIFRTTPLGVLGITLASTVLQSGELRFARPRRSPLVAHAWNEPLNR